MYSPKTEATPEVNSAAPRGFRFGNPPPAERFCAPPGLAPARLPMAG